MITIKNLFNNQNIRKIDEGGVFAVIEHQHDFSVGEYSAQTAYFMEKMNVKKRQVICQLNNNGVKIQAGAMQWTTGNIEMDTGVTSTKDFFGKFVKSVATGESAVKPTYFGNGFLMLEPTYNHLFIMDVSSWGSGVVLDDGMFLACEQQIQERLNKRNDVATALLSGEGIFNLTLSGNGYCVVESPVPKEELVEFILENDTLKIDGNMAVAWSESLQLTTEKSGKSILASIGSGEGVVNVYRGTGKVLVAPTMTGTINTSSNGPEQTTATNSSSMAESVVKSTIGSFFD